MKACVFFMILLGSCTALSSPLFLETVEAVVEGIVEAREERQEDVKNISLSKNSVVLR